MALFNDDPVLLPEGFEEDEELPMTDRYRHQIFEYCTYCARSEYCPERYNLLDVEAKERLPFYSEMFMTVDYPSHDIFFRTRKRVFCTQYESRQMTFPGFPKGTNDGIQLLLVLIELEKVDHRYYFSSHFGPY